VVELTIPLRTLEIFLESFSKHTHIVILIQWSNTYPQRWTGKTNSIVSLLLSMTDIRQNNFVIVEREWALELLRNSG